MFVVDLMHEFELGVWKAIFTHLLRLLYAQGGNGISKLNERYFKLVIFNYNYHLYTYIGIEISQHSVAIQSANLLKMFLGCQNSLLEILKIYFRYISGFYLHFLYVNGFIVFDSCFRWIVWTPQQCDHHGPIIWACHVARSCKASSSYWIHGHCSGKLYNSTGYCAAEIPVNYMCRIWDPRFTKRRSSSRTTEGSQGEGETTNAFKGKGKGEKEREREEINTADVQFLMLQTTLTGGLRKDYPAPWNVWWL